MPGTNVPPSPFGLRRDSPSARPDHAPGRSRRLTALTVALLLAASVSAAQFRRGGRGGRTPVLRPSRTTTARSSSAASCSGADPNGDGGDWSVDWPRADENLSIRLSELTKTPVGMDADGIPKHLLLRLTDPMLFRCPFIMMTEVGSAYLDDSEAAQLRDYLLKGGFLWADDFWGEFAWDFWERQLRKALPVGPVSHRRSGARPSALPHDDDRQQGAADRLDRFLDGQRRRQPPNAAATAPSRTPAPSTTITAGSWC